MPGFSQNLPVTTLASTRCGPSLVAAATGLEREQRQHADVREALLASAWWDWPVDEVKRVARALCSTDMPAFLRYIEQRNG